MNVERDKYDEPPQSELLWPNMRVVTGAKLPPPNIESAKIMLTESFLNAMGADVFLRIGENSKHDPESRRTALKVVSAMLISTSRESQVYWRKGLMEGPFSRTLKAISNLTDTPEKEDINMAWELVGELSGHTRNSKLVVDWYYHLLGRAEGEQRDEMFNDMTGYVRSKGGYAKI